VPARVIRDLDEPRSAAPASLVYAGGLDDL
jgi:hypothetical protein